jgi:hypothetical protein
MSNPLERVPYFNFANREVGEDRPASLQKGYPVPLVKTFILITPHGHRGDPMEFIAEDFIARKTEESRNGRYNHQWVEEFKAGMKAFLEGNEIPRSGTPLATWGRLLKSRREALSKIFPTVEDLAAVPDSGLQQIGLDGRMIRDMAAAEIQAMKDLSPVVRELAEAKEDNRRKDEQIAALNDKLAKLSLRLDTLEEDAPRRGRPRKEAEAA